LIEVIQSSGEEMWRVSNTVLQPRYWGREADSPEVCRLVCLLVFISLITLLDCGCPPWY
jgi:hypothetical protein